MGCPHESWVFCLSASVQPEIHIKNQRIGQQLGKDTILECHITAFPHAVNYWMKDGERISSSSKYRIDAFDEEGQEIILSLWINELEEKDFGRYKCVAANSLGSDEETMIVYSKTSWRSAEFYIHLKLELLTQFPASNEHKKSLFVALWCVFKLNIKFEIFKIQNW